MAIQAAIVKEYEDNFLLDEAKLRKISNIFSEYSSKLKSKSEIEYYVQRENQSSYTTKNIEEVLADENAAGKRIVTIQISLEPLNEGGAPDQKQLLDVEKTKAFIVFTKQKLPRVRIGLINENRDWCFLLADELDNLVKRLLRNRPLKFVPLRILDGVVFASALLGLFAWCIWWLASRPPAFTLDQISQMSQDQKLTELLKISVKRLSKDDWIFPILLAIFSSAFFVLGYRPLARLIEYLTESTFHWGDAISHFDRREKLAGNIKWVVIAGFIISVIAGLATTGLLNFWTKH